MFERFTEKSRRVIFFARYEATEYGSPFIESQHLLLGLLRDDGPLVLRFLQPKTTATKIPTQIAAIATEVRTHIEKKVTRREKIPTSVEVPLTDECKKILFRAEEEANKLRDRHIGTEHLLLAMLGFPDSLAAQLLVEKGADVQAIREQIDKTTGRGNSTTDYIV